MFSVGVAASLYAIWMAPASESTDPTTIPIREFELAALIAIAGLLLCLLGVLLYLYSAKIHPRHG